MVIIIAAAMVSALVLQDAPLIQTNTHTIARDGEAWCSDVARIRVFERASGTEISTLPDHMRGPVEHILRLECPQHRLISVETQPIQVAAPSSSTRIETRYFRDDFTAIVVTRDARFSHIETFRPEFAVVERHASGQLTLHLPELNCSSPLRRAREREMLDPHSHILERDPIMGRAHPRSVIDAARPEFFKATTDCLDRSFTVYQLDRDPPIHVHYVREFPDVRNGRPAGRARHGFFRPLRATSLNGAIEEAREVFIEALDEAGSAYALEYERDHSAMVMAEYEPYVGRPANARVRGMSIFDFGWFRVSEQGGDPVFTPRRGARYSTIERIGEAITFTENPDGPNTRTVIIAPYPYGTSVGQGVARLVFGIDPNSLVRSDYHMRQIIICTPSSGLMQGTSFVRFVGTRRLTETVPGSCTFRSEGAMQEFIGHFETGGQAANPDRQSMLTRMTGGGFVYNTHFACGIQPEFTIAGGIMQLRGLPCDRPSEPMSALDRPPQNLEAYRRRPNAEYAAVAQ